MFGLGQQVSDDVIDVGTAVGQDERLGRTGQRLDPDGTVELLLGVHDESVARPDDLVDPRDRVGTEGQGSDGLGSPDRMNLAQPELMRDGQYERMGQPGGAGWRSDGEDRKSVG